MLAHAHQCVQRIGLQRSEAGFDLRLGRIEGAMHDEQAEPRGRAVLAQAPLGVGRGEGLHARVRPRLRTTIAAHAGNQQIQHTALRGV